MPRVPRSVVPGHPLHLIQRGNNRTRSFVAPEDYAYYKRVLRESSVRARCAVHAYVLMTNHVHLLVTPESAQGPARMMQAIGRRYVRYFNESYSRTGTLWEGRYRSTLVDSLHYFFACMRYVELNPVRAGVVMQPGEYRWSSFRRNAHGEADAPITPHALYLALGSVSSDRQAAYRAMFACHLDMDAVNAIRRATNAGTVLGTTPFREELEARLQRMLKRLPHGGDRRSDSFRGSTTLTP